MPDQAEDERVTLHFADALGNTLAVAVHDGGATVVTASEGLQEGGALLGAICHLRPDQCHELGQHLLRWHGEQVQSWDEPDAA